MSQYTVVEIIPDPEEGGFTARVPDLPAYGEGETEEEAIADLKEALQAYIGAFGVEDALARMNPPSALRQLDWNLFTRSPTRRFFFSVTPRLFVTLDAFLAHSPVHRFAHSSFFS